MNFQLLQTFLFNLFIVVLSCNKQDYISNANVSVEYLMKQFQIVNEIISLCLQFFSGVPERILIPARA